jgi:hypothetical protein
MVSYSCSEISVMGFLGTIPTVLTTISILPKSCRVSAKSLSTAAAVVQVSSVECHFAIWILLVECCLELDGIVFGLGRVVV